MELFRGRVCFSILLLALVSCGEPARQNEPGPAAEPEPAASPVAAYMNEHFEQATSARDAIVRGDIEGVRGPAKRLAGLQAVEGLPEGWEPYVEQMRTAARLTSEARTLPAAASATAAMVQVCGGCHKGLGVEPRAAELGARGSPPSDRIGAVPHMLRHGWALQQMWIGLINPSDEAWRKGVEVLSDAPLEPQEMTNDAELVRSVGELAERVREIADRASQASDTAARALLYGDLLATCSLCHEKLGKGPK